MTTEYKRLHKLYTKVSLLQYSEEAEEDKSIQYLDALDDTLSIIEKQMEELRYV